MKLLNIFFLLLLVCNIQSYSQEKSLIKGTVSDSLNKRQLQHAVVTLVRIKDSVLVAFTRTKLDGSFELNNIPKQNYIINISSPAFADYTDSLTVSSPIVNIGNITLTTKAKLLEDVVVKQKIAAIRFKGDTLEYKADSFKVGANANVQDLLRKMPGISINSKGEITAQGQSVKKILVDGEEFFSDDPAVVTKGLRADAIDKVQVFDKKSDQATFTGIDDGVKDRTINLQMKDEKKKGYFGKLEAGSDFGDYRYGKAMGNFFKGKQKIAAYITTDNTNFESLNWNEKSNYGEDLNRNYEMNEDGGMSMWSSGDNFSWGEGFPSSNTGGLHFSKKWNEDKNRINNTFQHNQLNVYGGSENMSQTLLADSTTITNNEQEFFDSYKRRNRLHSLFEHKIDSTSDYKITVTGSIINTITTNETSGNSSNNLGKLLNDTYKKSNNNATEKLIVGNFIYRKRFKKKGRTISLTLDAEFADNKRQTNLVADNKFYTSSSINQNIDQLKNNNEDKNNLKTRVAFTEPVFKNTYLEINSSYSKSNNDAVRSTFDRDPANPNNYNVFIDSLSTNFKFDNYSLFAGTNLKYQGKKVTISFGTNLGRTSLKVIDNLRFDNREALFTNWQPNFNFNYSPSKQTRFGISYSGRNRNPSLMQIQPFRDNSNPLILTVGNPNLLQEFSHNISFNFSDYKILKSKNVYISGDYSFTNNAITSASTVDVKTGQTINQAVNVNGNQSFFMWASYGFDIAESFNLNFNFNPNLSRYVNIINGVENVNNSGTYSFRLSSGYWGEKWINYWIGFGPSYNTSTSTINPTKTEYWTWGGNYDFTLKWKKQRITANLNGDLNFYQTSTQFSNNANYAMLNVYIKKAIDKDEKFEIQIGVHDLLNQNQGVSRNIRSNFISQNISRNIQRYGMLSFTYNFSKNGKPSNGW